MAHLDMHRMCFLTILLSTPVALKTHSGHKVWRGQGYSIQDVKEGAVK